MALSGQRMSAHLLFRAPPTPINVSGATDKDEASATNQATGQSLRSNTTAYCIDCSHWCFRERRPRGLPPINGQVQEVSSVPLWPTFKNCQKKGGPLRPPMLDVIRRVEFNGSFLGICTRQLQSLVSFSNKGGSFAWNYSKKFELESLPDA